jgi:hypothetical protein
LLPDYPKLKESIKERLYYAAIEEMSKEFPIASIAKMRCIHEGQSSSLVREDGSVTVIELKRLKSQMFMSYEECETSALSFVYDKMQTAIKEIIKQQAEMFVSTIDEAVTKTGNNIDMKGQKLTPDHILDMLKKIHIEFDSNGNPFMPKILAGTKGNESLIEAIKGLDIEPYKSKFENLINEKKREYLDRENNRKLVG